MEVGDKLKLELTLPVPTSINALYINQFAFNPKTRKREMTGARILSKDGTKRKEEILFHATQQLANQEWDFEWTKDNFLYQDAIIYFDRRGRDADNIYKLLNDTLEGIVYDNDSRVLVRTQKVLYDTKNPRVEITLTPVNYIGIFETQEEVDEFTNRCKSEGGKGCSRYLNGRCNILTDSINGQVREEIGSIDDPYCTEFKLKKK